MNELVLIHVVDDDPGMRRSLGKVLESANLPHALHASAEDFLDACEAENSTRGRGARAPAAARLLVLDLQMPVMHGMELLRMLRGRGIDFPVIVVTGTGTVPMAVEAMKLGVVDFLEKPVDHRTLLTRIEQALARDAVQRAASNEVQAIRVRLAGLTAREREVLELIVRGNANKQIAHELGISIKTVAIHRANLMMKSGAVNTADLVRLSMLVEPR